MARIVLQVFNRCKFCYKRAMQCDKDTIKKRNLLTQKIRDFFVEQDFLEVETPIMTPIPGMEPYLTPFETTLTPPKISSNLFETHTNSKLQSVKSVTVETFHEEHSSNSPANPSASHHLPIPCSQIPLHLNTSPELQMKKLLGAQLPDGSSAGFDKIFNITKVFRNGEMDGPLHNPEFTMLEWYRKNADYSDLMKDCENLISGLVQINRLESVHVNESKNKLKLNQQTIYQSQIINFSTPWPRFTTNELFIKYCGINLLENQDFETFKKTVDDLANATSRTQNYPGTSSHSQSLPQHANFAFDSSGCENWDDLYFKIFLNHIEPELAKLNQPVFIYDYPATQAALAKKSSTNPFFAERFELYIKGIELANAFSELTDSKEQRTRLLEEQNLRKQLGKTVFPIDEEFLQALDQIKVPTAGIALGLDRLLMILLDKKSIEEVLLFPMNSMIRQI